MNALLSKKRNQLIAIITGVLIMTAFMACLSFAANDAFTMAGNAIWTIVGKLAEIAKVIFPVAIVIDGIALLVDHNEKRIAAEKTALIAMIVAYILILIVSNNKNVISDTFNDSLFNGATGGGTGAGNGNAQLTN